MIEFVWPQTNGEWLAWVSAVYLLLAGCLMLLVPRLLTGWLYPQHDLVEMKNQVNSLIRGPMAGSYIGLSIAVLLLHPQPLLYLALGSAFLFSAFGRFISIFADNRSNLKSWMMVIVDGFFAFSPLAYALGYIR